MPAETCSCVEEVPAETYDGIADAQPEEEPAGTCAGIGSAEPADAACPEDAPERPSFFGKAESNNAADEGPYMDKKAAETKNIAKECDEYIRIDAHGEGGSKTAPKRRVYNVDRFGRAYTEEEIDSLIKD